MNFFEEKPKTTILIKIFKENENGPIFAEQLFANLHGAPKKLSFEIANINGSMGFYCHFESKWKNLIEGQIYAAYPHIEIIEIPDYCEKISPENAIGLELILAEPDIYPIKRYPEFQDKKTEFTLDPLSGITSSLYKLNNEHEQAWIQIIIKPLNEKWRLTFIKCIRILKKGIFLNIEHLQKIYTNFFCTRSFLKKTILFPLYIIFWFQGIFSGVNFLQKTHEKVEEQSSKTHERETKIVASIDKVGKLMYETSIRIVYISQHYNQNITKLKEIANSFKQFNIHSNGFKIKKTIKNKSILRYYQKRFLKNSFILNIEELATIYHLPNLTVTTPNICSIKSKKLEPPSDLPANLENSTTLGKINFRNTNKEFGIKSPDRNRHIYIIGKTGMGKSTLLENMIYSDIQAGRGLAVVDPHGDLADTILNFIPAKRTNDVIIFNPSDREFPVAFNMLENIDPCLNTIVCSGLIGIFKKIYGQSWGPRLEHILRNSILALLEYPSTTILGIPRILQDSDFRKKVTKQITDPLIKNFWQNEFEKMDNRMRIEAISPILNKVGQFLSSPIIRNILGQTKSAINLRFAMDTKKIIIVNLSKGKIGEDTSSLLGAMIITKFQLDAMSRANIKEKDRTDFYLYIDEFQNFATDSFITILSEARKYKLNLTMANQYIAQMPREVKEAVFGNVGTLISFQVGFEDASTLSSEFREEVYPNDLTSLNKYSAYCRLLIDGMPSKTFSFDALPPPNFTKDENRIEKILQFSRQRYATPKHIVEDKIKRWHENINL